MPAQVSNTLGKRERLSGRNNIGRLLESGRWAFAGSIKYCWSAGAEDFSRMLVSVPKKLFKRAVKRNLLKRRIREAFRLNKSLLDGSTADIIFVYNRSEATDFSRISADVQEICRRVSEALKNGKNEH